ncbi:ankyrin repeat-containing domain protein [Aspergillus novoparasiticus]|uniref:Ankyrin repeat-containing domain protein n=1 Tax=Aspergillus novoparasiticus TaxID=986946 RepID=A0A5N6EBK0_9EURO|nr:ankyrin repeat-containing domain protein [Aspergillus novoparasiticus]
MLAAMNGHKEIVELLVHHGADINRQVGGVCTPILGAVGHGNVDVVEYLLTTGVDLDVALEGFWDYDPLELAAHEGHAEVVKLLLRHGVDPNKSSALALATGMGKLEAARVLLEAGANIERICTRNQMDALFNAVDRGNATVVSLLIEYGANLERRDNDGMTPLAYAAFFRRPEAAEVLLNHGANVNALSQGLTALSWAIDEGKVPMVKLLLENGADLTITNEPLLLRILKSNRIHNQEADAAIVELLLNHGADPNCCDRKGRTPLFLAAVKQKLDSMRVLLARGANPNREDEEIDLLSWAFLKGHEGVSPSIFLGNLKMAEEFTSVLDPTSWTAVLPQVHNAPDCQSPTTQSSHGKTQPPEYYYHVYKFGEPDPACLECLTQELPASDDDETNDGSDFDGEKPLPFGDTEYFPSGYKPENEYGDENMIDDSELLESSSCSSISTDGSEYDMEILDENDIEEIKTRTLMALPIHDFIEIQPIRSIIESFTQQQLADIVWKVLELDKLKVNQHSLTTYSTIYSHPSLYLMRFIQRHLTKEVPCPGDERVTKVLTFDDIDNGFHKKSKSELIELLEETLSLFHTARLYALLEEQIQALPEDKRQQIHTEARQLFGDLDSMSSEGSGEGW